MSNPVGRPRKSPPRFPVLDARIKRMGGVDRFCKKHFFSRETYYAYQRGLHEPTLYTIMRLLELTGLTFEEAFLGKLPHEDDGILREKYLTKE